MNYLIAVVKDRIQAEGAYLDLEKVGIKSIIIGKGYKTADEFGLIDSKEDAGRQVKFMAVWLVPFGFIAGISFNSITHLDTFPWAGEIGNRIIGGILGGVSGGLGSILAGGGVGKIIGGSDEVPYRNRLDAGKYLIIVQGSENRFRDATRILRRFDPENIQGYSDTTNS